MKKILKYISLLILVFLLYNFIFGILAFKFISFSPSDLNYDVSLMKQNSSEVINAKILDTHEESLLTRLNIILEAQNSINLTTLSIRGDVTGKLLYGALLDRANNGVIVNLVSDSLNTKKDKYLNAVASHPNINVYLYEPYDFFAPMSLNNILHDKILTVDLNYAIIGGRNSHDKYLLETSTNKALDRDVLLFNDNNDLIVIGDMNAFVSELIAYKHSIKQNVNQSNNNTLLQTELDNNLNEFLLNNSFYNINDSSVVVNNVTFVRSPLVRGFKDPVLYKTIDKLLESASEVIIQTPYITTSLLTENTFKVKDNLNYTFITNNVNSNPNIMAVSNYIKIRKDIAKDHTLYELQLEHSIHAKSLVIDGDISIIGSQNLDSRSMFLSSESMVVIYSEEFNTKLRASMNGYISQSLKVNSDGSYEESSFGVSAVEENFFKKVLIFIVGLFTNMFKEML